MTQIRRIHRLFSYAAAALIFYVQILNPGWASKKDLLTSTWIYENKNYSIAQSYVLRTNELLFADHLTNYRIGSIQNPNDFLSSIRDHPFKTSACLRGGGVSQYIRIKNPLHKYFAGMPMVGGAHYLSTIMNTQKKGNFQFCLPGLHCCRSYQGEVIRLIFHHNSNWLKIEVYGAFHL